MTESTIDADLIELEAKTGVVSLDRRRAGRREVNPALLPLLRAPSEGDFALAPPVSETPFRDFLETDPYSEDLAPARGILVGLMVSMLFWGGIGYAIFR